MDRKLLKTAQTITTFRNRLADPVGTRRGPPLVRGPQFENRWIMVTANSTCGLVVQWHWTWVRVLAVLLSGNNLGQVVRTCACRQAVQFGCG